MKEKFVISIVVCLCFVGIASAYSGSKDITETFDGPAVTHWDEIAAGTFDTGKYVMGDTDNIFRYIDRGPFTATIEVTDIDLAMGDFAAGNAGYFGLLVYDGFYRLHVSVLNANDGVGDQIAVLGDDGSGYALWSNTPIAGLTSLILQYTWDPSDSTISLWVSVNGGPMNLYVDNKATNPTVGGVMLEQINAAETIGAGQTNDPDSPTFALDYYDILGPQVTILEGDGVSIDEEGPTSDTYDVVLSTDPNDTVTVMVAPVDAQIQVSSASASALAGEPIDLTFTKANWFTPQTVTVTAVDDAIQEGPHNGLINHIVSSSFLEPVYDGLPTAAVQVDIADNEGDICGQIGTVYYAADLSGPTGAPDCYVNIYDFVAMASDWLNCTDPADVINCVQVLP